MLAPANFANILQHAVAALERREFAAAERGFRAVLAAHPEHLGALKLLAMALVNHGRAAEAEEVVHAALRIDKRDPGVVATHAIVLRSLGRSEEALRKFDRAVRLDPKNPAIRNNRGILRKDLGQYDEAIDDFDAALALDRNNNVARYNKAGALVELGRLDRALALFDETLKAAPGFAAAWNGRGAALADLKRGEEAIASFDRAIALEPKDAFALFNRGGAAVSLERFDEAIASYDRALALDPNLFPAHYNRGNALRALNRFEDAIASYDRAIALRPDFIDAHFNRANALRALARYDEAADAYRATLRFMPDNVEAWNSLGGVLVELDLSEEALAAFDRAVALKPGHADAQFNRSLVLLLRGDFDAGWRAYEWRKRKSEPLGARAYRQPLWLGDRDLAGKTILVHFEQGFGDTIQFCCYLRLLEREGARVLFAPQKPLARLMRTLPPTVAIVDADDPSLEFDLHCPLMSLPLAFHTTLATIPASVPYLDAEPERLAAWRERLGGDGFKIGVAWRGSALGGRVGRPAPLGEFAKLAAPGVRLISLHKEEEGAGAPPDPAVEWLGPDFDAGPDAFLDAAAVIRSLDLVISVDTAIAHLACALAQPIWIALSRPADWRWLADRADSPWRPTARLFRQRAIGDWPSVFDAIAAALAERRAAAT